MKDRAWIEARIAALRARVLELAADLNAHKGAVAALEEVLADSPPEAEPPPVPHA